LRAFLHALLLFTLGLGFVGAGQAQNKETFAAGSGSSGSTSAGPGGAYDASVCNDPRIPILAAQQHATPYHDPNWNTPGDPLEGALEILAQKYNNSNIDNAGACAHAPGVVYMVPTNLIPEVTKLIGQIETIESGGGGNNNAKGGTPSSGQPSGGPSGTNRNGQPIAGGTNGGTSGGSNIGGVNGGGPPANYAPMPGPAGGIGYQPGPNPCLPKGPGGYDYCANGPGARLPAGCYCDGPPDSGGAKGMDRKTKLGPPPPPPPATRPNLLVIIKQMNDCLKAKLPYWEPANVQSQYMDMARQGASAAVRSTPPQMLDYQTQVFVVETAMAMQAQAVHDQKFGRPRASAPPTFQNTFDPADVRDYSNPAYAPSYVAGWLERCLVTAGMQPTDNMLRPYANFLGVDVKNGKRRFGPRYHAAECSSLTAA
jgi:hypothetical protein